jgi:integrase
MAGSVTRQGTTWQYVVDLGLDGNGRRRQYRRRGFPTKKAAQQAMLEAQSLQLRGELANPGRRTLEDYLTQWLDAVQASLEPAAWTNYRNCLRLYVLPRLGHVQLGLLTPLTLSSMYSELLRSGGRKGRPLSPTSVRLVHGVLRKALNDGCSGGCSAPIRHCARASPSAGGSSSVSGRRRKQPPSSPPSGTTGSPPAGCSR